MKKSLFIFLITVTGFLWVQTSYSFNLGDFVKELEKPPQKDQAAPAKQPSEQTQEPSRKPAQQQPSNEGGGGLIGLGESLGIFDKKTSRTLRQSVKTLQAFQPIGEAEEKAIGGSLAVAVFDRFGGPYNDPDLQRYVTLVGQAVAEFSNRPEIDYHFAVLNTEAPNAFATPGGYVFVSIGLLRQLKNEAQLAGVLGHEIAHITRKHALQTLQRSKMLQGMSGLTLAVMDKDAGLFDKVINEVSDILFTRGLDKNLEFEADRYGTEFAYRTGYYPGGLMNSIKTLGKSETRHQSIFMSTHPGFGERFKQLSKAMRRYKSAALYPILFKRFQSRAKGHL